MTERDMKIRIAHATMDFFYCPNSDHIIEVRKDDDKGFCNCGKPNPAVPGEPPGLHTARTGVGRQTELLLRASAEDWYDQEQQRRIDKRMAEGRRRAMTH